VAKSNAVNNALNHNATNHNATNHNATNMDPINMDAINMDTNNKDANNMDPINFGTGPKYPSVKVQAPGTGGFNPTVSAVQAALRGAGVPLQELSNFYEDAAEGGEGNLLRTCMRWVDLEVG
jgi:uncharacterized protein involved in copper resistance